MPKDDLRLITLAPHCCDTCERITNWRTQHRAIPIEHLDSIRVDISSNATWKRHGNHIGEKRPARLRREEWTPPAVHA